MAVGARWAAGALLVLLAAFVGEAGAVCSRADREGTYLAFDGTVALENTGTLPAVFAQSLTVQLFVRLDDAFVYSDAAGPSRTLVAAGTATAYGWRLGCARSKCCLQAAAGSAASLGEVCTGTLPRGVWHQLTATYSPGEGRRAQGLGRLFVDGKKVGESSFGVLGDAAIVYPSGVRKLSIGGMDNLFVKAHMDEIRVWNVTMTESEVLDTAHEIGWWATCTSAVSRIASISGTRLTSLILYINDAGSDRSSPMASGATLTLVRGTDVVTNAASYGGSLTVVGGEFGLVATDFVMGATEPAYIEMVPRVELLDTSQGVLKELNPPMAGESVSTVVSQHENVVLDYMVRDPNYDDVIELMRRMNYNHTTPECYARYVMGLTLQCNVRDDAGWAAYAGVPGYFSHTDVSTVNNAITSLGLGSGAPDLGAQRTSANTSCLLLAPKDGLGLPRFLPPNTETQSRFIYRLAWTHLTRYQWWIGGDHQSLFFEVRSTRRYPTQGTAIAATVRLNMGYTMHISPEWVNAATYPMYPQGDDSAKTFGATPPALSVASGMVIATSGMKMAVTVGDSLSFKVRVRDRNNRDSVTISAREDPGLPPGRERLQFVASSRVAFPNPPMSQQIGNILCETSGTYPPELKPPDFFDRDLTYTPQEADMGSIYKVCFYASSSALPPDGVDKKSEASLTDLCVTIEVLKTAPLVALPTEVTTFVGCPTEVPIVVSQTLSPFDMAAQAYTYRLIPTEELSAMCDSAGNCRPIPGGLPRGAVLVTSSQVSGETRAMLKWRPERGQEMESAYRVCFMPEAIGVDLAIAGRPTPTCMGLVVRKCQMCLGAGQSLASVAQLYSLDFLELYMANPFITSPDKVRPGTLITTGATYRVREGDSVHALAARFAVSVEELLGANPDVRMANGTLLPERHLCVRTPSCSVTCKFGTDCLRTK